MAGGSLWSELPEDLVSLVSERLHSFNDYSNFICVCKTWWMSSVGTHHRLMPRPPLLLQADHVINTQESVRPKHQSPRRSFLGLDKEGGGFMRKVYELDVPEIHQSRCVGSNGNWIVTVDEDHSMRIFNPFSRVQSDLPSQSTLRLSSMFSELNKEQLREVNIKKAVLSSPPNNNSSGDKCVALVIHDRCRYLSIARPGDISWTQVSQFTNVDDVIFFKEKFYVVLIPYKVFVCDFDGHPQNATGFLKGKFPCGDMPLKCYLVAWSGELLLVVRRGRTVSDKGEPYIKTFYFTVYKFDFDNLRLKMVKNLGHHSLFLGFNTSVAVLASDSSVFRGNCIYFTDDCHRPLYTDVRTERSRSISEGGQDMGVFDLENRTIQPLCDDIVVTSRYSPPVWIVPKSVD